MRRLAGERIYFVLIYEIKFVKRGKKMMKKGEAGIFSSHFGLMQKLTLKESSI